ncbi:aldehyde dehydrogenase, partial [Xanthomonas perforans]|nr:aldehyde dehydrogenase [Xanthomonas perforans]
MHADLDVCAEDIAALFAAQQPVAAAWRSSTAAQRREGLRALRSA